MPPPFIIVFIPVKTAFRYKSIYGSLVDNETLFHLAYPLPLTSAGFLLSLL